MTDKELDLLLISLQNARERKKDVALAKANAEIEAIQRETDAYWDGAYDAIKELKKNNPNVNIVPCHLCKHGVPEAPKEIVFCQKLEKGVSIVMPWGGFCCFGERTE